VRREPPEGEQAQKLCLQVRREPPGGEQAQKLCLQVLPRVVRSGFCKHTVVS